MCRLGATFSPVFETLKELIARLASVNGAEFWCTCLKHNIPDEIMKCYSLSKSGKMHAAMGATIS